MSLNRIKRSNLKQLLIVLPTLLVVVTVGWFIYERVKEDEHVRDIQTASRNLEKVFESIKSRSGGSIVLDGFKKSCNEMSVKYEKGRIACVSNFSIYLDLGLEKQQSEERIEKILRDVDNVEFISSEQSNFSSSIKSRWIRFKEKNNQTSECHLEIVNPDLEYYNKHINKDSMAMLTSPPTVVYGNCSSKYTFNDYISDFIRNN